MLVDWGRVNPPCIVSCEMSSEDGIDADDCYWDLCRTSRFLRKRPVNWEGKDLFHEFDSHVANKKPNANDEVFASIDWISKCIKYERDERLD